MALYNISGLYMGVTTILLKSVQRFNHQIVPKRAPFEFILLMSKYEPLSLSDNQNCNFQINLGIHCFIVSVYVMLE